MTTSEEAIKTVIDQLNQIPDFDGTISEHIRSEVFATQSESNNPASSAAKLFHKTMLKRNRKAKMYSIDTISESYQTVMSSIGKSQARLFWIALLCNKESKPMALKIQMIPDNVAILRNVFELKVAQ